ncbi:MAG TPA: hypothetical protein DCO77_08795, partial [Nitrospiraceae bacterium]|nr:hypothetical protein [Nitrospiraceae bacterium]
FTTINQPAILVCSSSQGDVTYATSTVVSCAVTDPSGLATVTIGGFNPRYDATTGLYWRKVWLQNIGVNAIPVAAVDSLGNPGQGVVNVTRLELPDLSMEAISGPTTGIIGGTIPLSNTVRNAGPGDSQAFTIGFYLSPDAAITDADIYIGDRSVYALASGDFSSTTTDVSIPGDLVPGSYYIGAIADYLNEQFETDDYNNSLVANNGEPITINGPDLTMTMVSGPLTGQVGGSIKVSNTAENIGLGTASRFNVHLYLSENTVLGDDDDEYLGKRTVYGLLSNGSSSDNTEVTIPMWLVAEGLYYIGAIADHDDVIMEEDENNNSLLGDQIEITN